MLFQPVNIKEKLVKEKEENSLLFDVHSILGRESDAEKRIFDTLKNGDPRALALSHFEPQNIFHIRTIRSICIRYRLRFLGTKHFKQEFPYEAVMKIRELERKNNIVIRNFRIAAPSEAFSLIDRNKDPLLFADLGNGYYYLICQWGNDFAWHRSIFSYPMRSIRSFLFTALCFAVLMAGLVPLAVNVQENISLYNFRMFVFFLSFLGFIAFAAGWCFYRDRYVSDSEWNSKYLS